MKRAIAPGSASGIFLICGGIFVFTGSVSIAAAILLKHNMEAVRLNGTGDVEFLPLIFALSGIIAFAIGCGLLTAYFRKQAMRERLFRNGLFVTADITGFPVDYSIRVNRMPVYRVECRYQDPVDGVVHIFRSEPITIDPSPFVRVDTVRVYVARDDDYRTYYVDVNSILPEIRRH